MDFGLTQAIGQLAGSGLLGCVVVVLGYAYWKKDLALSKQSTDNLSLVIALQREVITAVTKITDLVDFIERREQERVMQQHGRERDNDRRDERKMR